MIGGKLPVIFHGEDAQGEQAVAGSEYKQCLKLLLPIYVSEFHNKCEVAQTEAESEAGLASNSSEQDGTLLNDSHKPWATTDRKVSTYLTRSESKLHPLRHNNGLRGFATVFKHRAAYNE